MLTTSSATALDSAYREHYPRIRRMFKSALKDQERAEDLAADTFVLLARKLEDGETPLHYGAYITVLAEGVLKNEIKRLARGKDTTAPVPALDAASERLDHMFAYPPLSIEDVEFRCDFDRAVRELPEDAREAFILTELRGLTVREAAPIIGVHLDTVARRAEAARARIRSSIEGVSIVRLDP
jgi:RNA polymerase sigma-70 factor (ECF subfamily)